MVGTRACLDAVPKPTSATNAQPEKREATGSLLNGPHNRQGQPDAVADQGPVDDLLTSSGF